jgi:hypothetical protein
MQFLNLSSEEQLELAYLNLDLSKLEVDFKTNPLFMNTGDTLSAILDVIRDPIYLPYTCQHIFDIDLLPIHHAMLLEIFNHPFPMLVASRGFGKTFGLALYIMYRLLINQGIKIVVVGAAFRQAKHVYEYCKTIWNRASVLRSICPKDGNSGPRAVPDRCSMRIGESVATFLPLGNGDTIRGERAHITIADEFSMIPVEVYETVIKGFGAVSQDPIGNVKQLAKIGRMKDLGLWNEKNKDKFASLKYNQAVIAGTAYYSFNSFYHYFSRYKKIIESQGDETKLRDIYPHGVPEHFDHNDYCIIRIPEELIPPGFLDLKQLSQTEAMTSESVYMMEYKACLLAGTEIVTDLGLKKIEDVEIGDMILTHKGRFRPVVETMNRSYSGDVVKFKSKYNNREINVTSNHPFFYNGDWIDINSFTKNDNVQFSNLLEFRGSSNIRLSDYTDNVLHTIVDGIEYIYPKPSRSKNHIDKFKKFKSCIPENIKLDYHFGVIVGYYASEGSVGAEGRQTNFALDGHKDLSLEYFIQELSEAILFVFGKHIKKYYNKEDNICSVNINSRLVSDLLKKICPGICYDKSIDPKILYSNKDFMKGLLVGYWHGDGCLNPNRMVVGCSNKSLLSQIRLCMSYFGFITSLLDGSPPGVAVFRGKEYKTNQSYNLVLSKTQMLEWVKFLHNIDYYPNVKSQYVNSKITEFSKYKYNGLVYNLEVDEDHSYSLINACVHNCFPEDSTGFFKRSLIESCVIKDIMEIGNETVHPFRASLRGGREVTHVFAIDPASEKDNLAIVILACYPNYRKILYCWTIRKEILREKIGKKLVEDQEYYGYCARKIRDLMKSFQCDLISIDSQGGGHQLLEALGDKKNMLAGELPIYLVTPDHQFSDQKERDTDMLPGLHIVELVNFSLASYVVESNHGLRKDMEDKVLLFPLFDAIALAKAEHIDNDPNKLYDTLEDCMLEIEELKDELSTIVHTQVGQSMRDRWDTPEVKLAENKKGRLRKDRYSALLMGNMAARRLQRKIEPPALKTVGGFAGSILKREDGPLYAGPSWFTDKVNTSIYGNSVRRNGV